jgi:hypothetical protein
VVQLQLQHGHVAQSVLHLRQLLRHHVQLRLPGDDFTNPFRP